MQGAGGVAGYVLGSPDGRLYRRAVRRVLRGAWRDTPPSALPGVIRYLLRAALYPGPHAPEDRYPAQLHLNLLPRMRGQRLGDPLLAAHLEALRALGVPGVQLSTTSENRAALALYRRHGFQVAGRRVTDLWTPWLGYPAEHVVMTLDLT
ncbi:N-acetyltransferase family protein [Deinococcus sp. JMULE3]|uniref:GNAT family N-acetyltransferase n=1 Tax=Deinococcus sp. JMULE3 TaxID=2518341 RepID=UPI003530308A